MSLYDPIPINEIPELDINNLMMSHVDTNKNYWLIMSICSLIQLEMPRYSKEEAERLPVAEYAEKRLRRLIDNLRRGEIIYEIGLDANPSSCSHFSDAELLFSSMLAIQASQSIEIVYIFFGIRKADRYPFFFAWERDHPEWRVVDI